MTRMRSVVSFVRRSSRLNDRQQRAWDQYARDYIVEVPRNDTTTSVDPKYVFEPEEVFGRKARFVLEIGSGVGEAIVADALNNPDEDFLGLEVWNVGLAQTIVAARREGPVANMRLVDVDAAAALPTMFKAQSVDEVRVFFPDPWPKKKHQKRRIVSPDFARDIRRILKPGGDLRLATDWEEYAEQMREVLDAAPGFERSFTGDWASRFERRVVTKFERRGIAAGHTIRDLHYVVR